jgi:hypothetical protein
MQDVVADAMTVEAVPRVDADGSCCPRSSASSMHTTMQTLGRVAIIGGGVLVSLVNVVMLRRRANLPPERARSRPICGLRDGAADPDRVGAGVAAGAGCCAGATVRACGARAWRAQIVARMRPHGRTPAGQLVDTGRRPRFALRVARSGAGVPVGAGDRLRRLDGGDRAVPDVAPAARARRRRRATLVGTAVVIFVFRAHARPGPGSTWWMIDVLGFDQQFLSGCR